MGDLGTLYKGVWEDGAAATGVAYLQICTINLSP